MKALVEWRGVLGNLLAGMIALACLAGAEEPGKRPNIVLIMADDLGTETIGCYGGKDYRTPNIDALAAAGVRFSQCYSQPLCTPSRVQIMTGRYNHRNYEGFGYLNPGEITFGNLLKAAGYRTCIAGKWQLGGDAGTVRGFGFDEFCLWNMHAYRKGGADAEEPVSWLRRYDAPTLYENGEWKEYPEGVFGPRVCTRFIKDFIAENREHPFFVYYPMILAHDPFVFPPGSAADGGRGKKRKFIHMVDYMDGLVGGIVAELEKQGVLENTLILFTGDNGTHQDINSATAGGKVQGGKSLMTAPGIHVPLVARWPGKAPAGKVTGDLVDFSDFLPTLCEAAGAATPADRVIDGRSFLPQIRGEEGDARDWVFCHYWGHGREKETTREFIMGSRWKLYGDGQLYDLTRDPGEESPLPAGEAPAERKRLQAALDEVRKP